MRRSYSEYSFLLSDIDTVAIVGICVHVHDVVVFGSAHDPIRRHRPKILLRLRRIREAHVKPRRHQHPFRISYLESLDRRACRTEEHRYGEEQGFTQFYLLLTGLKVGWAFAWRTLRRRNGLRRELLDVATRAVINWPSFSNVFEMWVLSSDGRRASRVSQQPYVHLTVLDFGRVLDVNWTQRDPTTAKGETLPRGVSDRCRWGSLGDVRPSTRLITQRSSVQIRPPQP